MSKCRYCGSDNTITYYSSEMPVFLWPLAKEHADKNRMFTMNISICKTCGFAFNENLPSDELLREIFDDYRYSSPNKGIGSSTFGGILELIRKNVPSDGFIVDIGASSGYVLKELHGSGYENLLGIDPSPMIPDDFPIPFRKAYFTPDTAFERNVTAFLMIYVLQQFSKPWEFVEAISSKLDDGCFFVTEFHNIDYAFLLQFQSYTSVPFMVRLAKKYSLEVIDADLSHNSNRLVFKKTGIASAYWSDEEMAQMESDAFNKAMSVRDRSARSRKALNDFVKSCGGDDIYWWGTGATASIASGRIDPELRKSARFVVVDGDSTRESLIFTPFGEEVHFAEKLLGGKHVKNLIIPSMLDNEILDTMKRIGCTADDVFTQDKSMWI